MDRKESQRMADTLAKDSIYNGAKYLGNWDGFSVYEPYFSDDDTHYIGFPSFILEKDGTLRWNADSEESIAIMEALPDNDEDYADDIDDSASMFDDLFG